MKKILFHLQRTIEYLSLKSLEHLIFLKKKKKKNDWFVWACENKHKPSGARENKGKIGNRKWKSYTPSLIARIISSFWPIEEVTEFSSSCFSISYLFLCVYNTNREAWCLKWRAVFLNVRVSGILYIYIYRERD